MKKLALILAALFMSASIGWASQLQLETIGAASGSSLYLTYISIGVTADAYEKQTYPKETAASFIKSIVAQAKVVRDYLQKLIDQKELGQEDIGFVSEMIVTYNLLVNEGEAFITYLDTGDKKAIESFHKNRKEAWAKIEKLLGIGGK